jgi:hypothetical protein
MFKNNPKKFGVFTNVGQIMSFKPNINMHENISIIYNILTNQPYPYLVDVFEMW